MLKKKKEKNIDSNEETQLESKTNTKEITDVSNVKKVDNVVNDSVVQFTEEEKQMFISQLSKNFDRRGEVLKEGNAHHVAEYLHDLATQLGFLKYIEVEIPNGDMNNNKVFKVDAFLTTEKNAVYANISIKVTPPYYQSLPDDKKAGINSMWGMELAQMGEGYDIKSTTLASNISTGKYMGPQKYRQEKTKSEYHNLAQKDKLSAFFEASNEWVEDLLVKSEEISWILTFKTRVKGMTNTPESIKKYDGKLIGEKIYPQFSKFEEFIQRLLIDGCILPSDRGNNDLYYLDKKEHSEMAIQSLFIEPVSLFVSNGDSDKVEVDSFIKNHLNINTSLDILTHQMEADVKARQYDLNMAESQIDELTKIKQQYLNIDIETLKYYQNIQREWVGVEKQINQNIANINSYIRQAKEEAEILEKSIESATAMTDFSNDIFESRAIETDELGRRERTSLHYYNKGGN